MALEMVSPGVKFNQAARVFQPSLEGGLRPPYSGGISLLEDGVLFSALTSLDEESDFLRVSGDPYVAIRNPAEESWNTVGTGPGGGRFYGIDGIPRAKTFNVQYEKWFHVVAREQQYRRGELQVVSGAVGGENSDVTSLLLPVDPLGQDPADVPAGTFDKGSSGDHSIFYFTPGRDDSPGIGPTRYLSGDPRPSGAKSTPNTYVARRTGSAQAVELLARDATGKVWGGNCGATIAGSANINGGAHGSRGASRGAISYDGSRVYFFTRPGQSFDSLAGEGPPCDAATNKVRIMVRSEPLSSPAIGPLFEAECDRIADPGPPEVLACGKTLTGPAPPAGGNAVPDGDDVYEGGSVDGSRVYFTSSRQLADSDVNGLNASGLSGCVAPGVGGCDLYLYDAGKAVGERLVQVTAGSNGESVPRMVQLSGDGSHAYFVSTEVLAATPGPGGSAPQAGQSNLYVYEAGTGELSFVGVADPESSWPVPVYGPDLSQSEAGGSGEKLVFTSKSALTADDLDGGRADVFLYDSASNQIQRISKGSAGAGDNGAFDVFTAAPMGTGEQSGLNDPADPDIGVRGRWVSEDGGTIAFKTAERLVASDVNQAMDSYLWREGELTVIPGTDDAGGGLFDLPLVSVAGDTVAFQSFQQLLPQDGDSAVDVYALRVDGGFKAPSGPVDCVPGGNGGCQGDAPPGPAPVVPTSAGQRSDGNVPSQPPACAPIDRRARALTQKAERLRQQASSAATAKAKRRLNQQATSAAKQAERERSRAKRCKSNGQGVS